MKLPFIQNIVRKCLGCFRRDRLQTIVGDVRYSAIWPANSAAAALGAFEGHGLKEVLMHCIFSQANPEDPAIYFVPPFSPEYLKLQELPWEEWYCEFLIERRFSQPDILQEVQDIAEIDRFWIHFDVHPDLAAAALETFSKTTEGDDRFVLISETPLPILPGSEHIKRCDPTGLADFLLLGEENLKLPKASESVTFAMNDLKNGRFTTKVIF